VKINLWIEDSFGFRLIEGKIFEANGEICIKRKDFAPESAPFWLGNKNMSPFAQYLGKEIEVMVFVKDEK